MHSILDKADSDVSRSSKTAGLTVADAVWVGVALLHQRCDKRSQFSIEEIVDSVVANNLTSATRTSIRQHVTQHCVANRKAQPNRSRMLYATREIGDPGDTHRRIFRDCDLGRSHPDRKDAPTHPVWERLPERYAYLRDWYEIERKKGSAPEVDPLLALAGTGSGLWDGRSADEYVASLREGWESFA